MRTFDPSEWVKTPIETIQPAPEGALKINCTDPEARILISQDGHSPVLAAIGSCDFWIPNDCFFAVSAKKGAQAFLYAPKPRSVTQDPTVYTNIDRQPHESGTMLEVRKALRAQEVRNQANLRGMREQVAAIKAAKAIAEPLIETASADDQVDPPVEDQTESAAT